MLHLDRLAYFRAIIGFGVEYQNPSTALNALYVPEVLKLMNIL